MTRSMAAYMSVEDSRARMHRTTREDRRLGDARLGDTRVLLDHELELHSRHLVDAPLHEQLVDTLELLLGILLRGSVTVTLRPLIWVFIDIAPSGRLV